MVDGAAPHRSKATMDYLAQHHATVALRRFPVGSPHMNAVEETWRRSKLDTQVCEYHGSLEGMKKQLAEYVRTTGFNLVQVFAETSFVGNNIVASLYVYCLL